MMWLLTSTRQGEFTCDARSFDASAYATPRARRHDTSFTSTSLVHITYKTLNPDNKVAGIFFMSQK